MIGRTRGISDAAALSVSHLEEQTALTSQAIALDIDQRLGAAGIVQELLIDLIDLSLQGKQARWNLRGRMFRDLHLLLDDLVEETGSYADRLAERCLALGVAADSRVATLAYFTHLDPFPPGRIEDRHVVDLMVTRLHAISEVGRRRLSQLGELDLVSQNLVLEVLVGVEKNLWMFEAHQPTEMSG